MTERISLLLPTRQRPQELLRLAESAAVTATHPEKLEVVTYIDNDDDSYDDLDLPIFWRALHGPRLHNGQVNLSVKWNECWKRATGGIFMHCGDDIVFRTAGWDEDVRKAMAARPGKICLVWCDDLSEQNTDWFGTHGFIHRNWTQVIGRFVPPYFVSDYNDTWINEVAERLRVKTFLAHHVTEHMHYNYGKAEMDANTRERLARHEEQHPEDIYNDTAKERAMEALALRAYIEKEE